MLKNLDCLVNSDFFLIFANEINKTIRVMEELKKQVKREIGLAFSWMDLSDIAELQDNLTDRVCNDVIETSDYPNYNDSDIRISITRILKEITKIGD